LEKFYQQLVAVKFSLKQLMFLSASVFFSFFGSFLFLFIAKKEKEMNVKRK